jgi:hypothetical protein
MSALIGLVRALEVQMSHQAARIGARPELVVNRMMRAAGDWDRFRVSAYAAINVIRRAIDLAPIKSQESMIPVD